jgi:predicted DsbA family dithiol-disulfide isomerase
MLEKLIEEINQYPEVRVEINPYKSMYALRISGVEKYGIKNFPKQITGTEKQIEEILMTIEYNLHRIKVEKRIQEEAIKQGSYIDKDDVSKIAKEEVENA